MQSRYYDPAIGRFINADSYVSTGQGVLGFNMFAYCRNNPVNRVDAWGTSDLCYDNNEDDGNPLNDYGPVTGGGGGASGGGGVGKISHNSVGMYTNDALSAAEDFLGPGYYEANPSGSGRFVSADGQRQVRIMEGDITGAHAGAPHINLGYIGKSWSFHIYLIY